MSRRFTPDAGCPARAEVARLLGGRDVDLLTAEETRALLRHLGDCPACRAEASRRDPTLLFAPLAEVDAALEPSLAADADRVRADVLSAIEVDRARSRFRSGGVGGVRRPLLYAASISLLGASLIGLLSLRRPEPPPPQPPVARPAAEAAAPLAAKPLIEGLANRGATIYQFAATSGEEPNVVFIVDRNADI